jgi:sec-independent protein translocase protein TatB
MADQFRKSFDEMARQSELDELRTELESLRRERPLADIDRTLRAPVLPPPNPAAPPKVPEASEASRSESVTDAAVPGPPP